MASWKLVLAGKDGTTLCELTTAAGIQLRFKRNWFGEVEFTISHEDEAAYLLLDYLKNAGIPTLRAYRDGVLRFNGYLAPFREELDETAQLTATFRGPLSRYIGDGSDRGIFGGEYESFSADAAEVVRSFWSDLLTMFPERPLFLGADGAFHLGIGLLGVSEYPLTVPRERTYEWGNLGEALMELAQLLDGYDFQESYIESLAEVIAEGGGFTHTASYLAELDIVSRLGSDQPGARFEYGPSTLANCRNVSRETQPPINIVRVLGGSGAYAERSNRDSVEKYDGWPIQVSATDIDDEATLEQKAEALLRPDPIRTVSFTPEYGLDNCPKPWDDFWLGDTVYFYASRGAFEEETPVRVNAITVTVDDNGNETAEIADPTTPDEERVIRANLTVEVV